MDCVFIPTGNVIRGIAERRCFYCGTKVVARSERIVATCVGVLKKPSRGLGDVIAKATSAIGVKPCGGCKERQAKLNRLVPFGQPHPNAGQEPHDEGDITYQAADLLPPAQTIRFRFPHGIGDNVQLVPVLRHLQAFRPDLTIDLTCRPECAFMFRGLVRAIVADGSAGYDLDYGVWWYEPDRVYPDSPSTKAEKHLREAHEFNQPGQPCIRPELWGYAHTPAPAALNAARRLLGSLGPLGADGRADAIVAHYTGRTARARKDLPDAAVEGLRAWAVERGLRLLLVDRERRSTLRNRPGVVCLPDSCDLETFAAVASLCRAGLGIDSGPGKLMQAVGLPTVIAWTKHHPVNFDPPMPSVLHLVRRDHERTVRGRPEVCLDFFHAHYRFQRYDNLGDGLVAAFEELLR